MSRFFIISGALNCLLAVALAAFGKHNVRDNFDEHAFEIFQTAGDYQIHNGLGLILIGIICYQLSQSSFIKLAGWLMLAGVVLFSGSLYILAITDFSPIRWLTPIGGTTLITAWLCLIWAGIKMDK
ncbi:MAG: DUF423 domain-containing protein [Magnetococcales bacterium]|nr:DUF423 domain-containing protein [Magnetococcales bacterium]